MEKFLGPLEEEIRAQKIGESPRTLYDPIRYILALGGKRMRPLLTILSYSFYKDDFQKVLPYAAAVETFHNFTLMHDDIMDNAPLRRGKPTVHEKWNVNTAILAGDVMLVKVYEKFQELEGSKLKEVLYLFNECATGVCEGQQTDMEFEKRKNVTETDYLDMIRLKTAVLLGFSLELGAVLANAPQTDRQILREFGISMGIGFQLKDDLMDVFADRKKFGKQVGGDIIANKKTFLLIKAMENARGTMRSELQRLIGAKKIDARKKIKGITAIYEKLGIRELTEKKIDAYFDQAFKSLKGLSSNAKPEILVKFVEAIAKRQS